jgi:hypothetical protein
MPHQRDSAEPISSESGYGRTRIVNHVSVAIRSSDGNRPSVRAQELEHRRVEEGFDRDGIKDRMIDGCRARRPGGSKPPAFAPPARLTRVNLVQTLPSFDDRIDARIEFRFGLFSDNSCGLRDGLDNRALEL